MGLKDWEFEWQVGDIRGVLEVITPMDTAMKDMNIARNKIIAVSLLLMILLVFYYAFVLLIREEELFSQNKVLSDDLAEISNDFDKYVIASKTDLKGIITYASKRFCEISGYSNDELVGKNHNIIRHLDMQKVAFKDLWKTIQADNIWTGEVKNLKKDGGYYWVEAIVSPLYDIHNIKIGYTAIRHDITDKKKLAKLNTTLEDKVYKEIEKNKLQNQQLIQQSRLAQMGEMISMIAHQWRQPLNAISLTASNLNLKCIIDDVDVKYFKEELSLIDEYSQHLSKTIDDFRGFFQNKKDKDTTTLELLVKDTLNIVKISLQNKKITILTNLNCNTEIQTYSSEVKQVILNIIKNAEDILLENEIQEPTITITTKLDKNNCLLLIKDNAGGIPQEIMQKIFDPYFSTKLEKDGTGLGLYMSKTIIEEHCGGTLHVENDKDGAVFTIVLGDNNN